MEPPKPPMTRLQTVPTSPARNDNPLTSLIRRLEAATSRLEDIASSTSAFEQDSSLRTPQATQPGLSAPELGGAAGIVSQYANQQQPRDGSAATPLPPAIRAVDEMIDGEVKSFVSASKGLDPLVEEQAQGVAQAFTAQRIFLLASTRAKKPDMTSPAFGDLIKDLQQAMGTVGDIRDSNRGSKMKEHLAMVGEGIAALQWLVMESKPADYVGEVIGGAQMYGNRVLKAYKETDQSHVGYVNAYYALLRGLQAYIKQHYPTGLTWNNKGVDAAEALREASSTASSVEPNGVSHAAPSGSAPPPPPPLPTFDTAPPPPPPPPGAPSSTAKSGGGDMDAVFAQLNRGEDVTKGLKKVDKSQMTHKNPSLRVSPAASEPSQSRSRGPETKPKPASMRQNSTASTPTKKEGKKELDGNKWLIENFDSPSAPVELDVSLTQSILISGCKNTTIILRGKANAISIDNSPRCQVLVETLISSVDVIKSPNFAVQVLGSLPTIMLDQVDGASIYLGVESLHTEIFTSKCSSVNIVLPPEGDDADSRECPLPEQIRTVVKSGKVVSEIVEYAG